MAFLLLNIELCAHKKLFRTAFIITYGSLIFVSISENWPSLRAFLAILVLKWHQIGGKMFLQPGNLWYIATHFMLSQWSNIDVE